MLKTDLRCFAKYIRVPVNFFDTATNATHEFLELNWKQEVPRDTRVEVKSIFRASEENEKFTQNCAIKAKARS